MRNKNFLSDYTLARGAENCLAVVLASGDNLPRRRLIPVWMRGQRPKYFCRNSAAAGGDYIINETRKQLALLFPPENTFFVVRRDHSRYYEQVLRDVAPANLIVEPQDDGDVFAVLYAALRLKKTHPSTVLAFFPPDFRAENERVFLSSLQSAVQLAHREIDLILLGMKPEQPIAGREWIEFDVSAPAGADFDARRVRRFLPETTDSEAVELMNKSALWHSGVTVGRVSAFLRVIRRAAPGVYARFADAEARIGTPAEEKAVQKAYYANYRDTDFARDVLAKSTNHLLVVPVPAAVKNGAGLKLPTDFAAEKHGANAKPFPTLSAPPATAAAVTAGGYNGGF